MPFDTTSKSHVKLELLVTNKNKKHLFQYQLLRHISSLNEGLLIHTGVKFSYNPREIYLIFRFRRVFLLCTITFFLDTEVYYFGRVIAF